jgi:DNA-directed RNA polymerase specialized sigma24 family protein
LFVVTKSKVARHFKKQAGIPRGTGSENIHRMIEEQPAPDGQAIWDLEYRRQMFRWASQQVKGQVSPKTWRAFWMTTVEDLPPDEVARELQMSLGAVYVAKSRVIARMRERIQSVAGELTDFIPPNLDDA